MSPAEFFALPPGSAVLVRASLLSQVGVHARNADVSGVLVAVGSGDVTEIVEARTGAETVTFAGSTWTVIGHDDDFIGIRRDGTRGGVIRLWVEAKDCTANPEGNTNGQAATD